MNENSYLKISCIVLYLAFAAISCWATAESLHLLLPDWPLVAAWAVTIGFFFIASWGTKMITDSLNQDIYMDNRGLHLLGGIFIVLVFWFLCSMPTNTHTFFYRSHVGERVTNDITTTKSYLAQIKDGTLSANSKEREINEFENELQTKIGELKSEIRNDANSGFGSKAKKILSDIATLVRVPKIEPLTYRGTSEQDREKLCAAYEKYINTLKQSRIANIQNKKDGLTHAQREKAGLLIENLNRTEGYIKKKDINLNDAEGIKTVCSNLNDGYSEISNNSQFVDFKSNEDKEAYTANNPQTKVSRLLSVYDVWADFLAGKDGGMHFAFWIFISVLIDIAAFVFFDIAFKKRS